MGYGIRVEVWGDYALFTRPEMKAERVSYDVMTPSAARGLLEAIYWHPGLRWHIRRIYVLNSIRFTNVRRNEVLQKVSASTVKSMMAGGKAGCLVTKESICQRASMLLKDVRYVIEADFTLTDAIGEGDTPEKFYNIVLRRLRRGQCFHSPYFGCREFPARFALWEGDADPATAYPGQTRELGYMLYDLDYRDPQNIQPLFFRATLENGVLDLRSLREEALHG